MNSFNRVMSLRDKRKPRAKVTKSLRSLSPMCTYTIRQTNNPVDFHGLFTLPDNKKKLTKEEEKKVADLTQRLHTLGYPDVCEPRLEYVLRAKSTNGDVSLAFKLLMILEDSKAGVLKDYDPRVRLLGAENREKTTCYLDALLFALFAREDVFEPVLFNSFDDEPRQRLVLILRLWVNMLRSGRLITVDITQQLQESLAACGWADAANIRQQDASEAFGFIMDKLMMPLVTLKTDIYHAGKEDAADDHKFITERLLEVAIPENVAKGEKITLEMCLEEYFNNRVEVKRAIQRRNTMQSPMPTSVAASSNRSSMEKGGAMFVETVEVDSQDDMPNHTEPFNKLLQRPGLSLRNRTPSIFSDRKVMVEDDEGSEQNATTGRKRAVSMKKEILMPAWQFLNLIPWYTDNNSPDDKGVSAHLASKRPMLGICLKRYMMTPKGNPMRLDTHIDIPLEITPPYFEDEGDLHGNYKLVLQAVVCHRGSSIHSGHYVALVRMGHSTGRRSDDLSTSTSSIQADTSSEPWVRFDDLANERVVPVDIKRALEEESPYLLFYRVQLVNEEPQHDHLPTYEESDEAFTSLDEKLRRVPDSGRTSFEILDWASRRTSVDHDNINGDYPRSSFSDGRRYSLPSDTPGLSIDQIPTEPDTPLEEPKQTGFMVSRQSTNKSTKPPPQAFGDNSKRFSLSMSKLASRLSGDKGSNNPEIIVNEVADDTSPVNTASVEPVLSSSPEDAKGKPMKPDKEKKKINFRSKSRRGSGDKPSKKSKEPDRECVVM